MTRNITKNRLALILLLMTMVFVNVGCQNTTHTDVPSDEKTLVVLQGVDATTLDPGMHSESTTGNIERQIFDTLLNQNKEMRLEPNVAKSWHMVNDTTWEFELRDDIYFHDGVQLTAADVKYSVDRILDKENASSQRGNFSSIKAFDIEDDFNFTITTDGPYPLLLVRLAGLRVVPKHYVEEVGMDKFGLEPIGSGPYKLDEWVKDEYVKLVANEDYWQGAPTVKKVMFKPVPEAAARVMALQKGEADIIVNLPPHQVDSLNEKDNTKVEKVDSTRFIMMPFTTKNPAVQDVRVRKAINYAIDVESIIESIFDGNATVSSQPVGNYDLGYHTELEPYGYNPEKAKELLAEAGYADGLELTMGSPSGRYIMDKEVAGAVKAQLEEAGFKVKLTFEEWGSYATKCLGGTMDYDLWLIGWGSSTFDAGSTLNFWLNSSLVSCYYQADSETNNYLDNLLNESLKTIDEEKRVDLYQKIVEKVYEDAVFANLYQQVDLYGVSSRTEWNARPDESIRVYEVSWK